MLKGNRKLTTPSDDLSKFMDLFNNLEQLIYKEIEILHDAWTFLKIRLAKDT